MSSPNLPSPVPIKDGRLGDLYDDLNNGLSVASSPTIVKSRPWNWAGLVGGEKMSYPVHTVDYTTYVQILTWFLDTLVREAPCGVYRMVLAGKKVGTDIIGQWFDPSVAAGAIQYFFFFSSCL